MKIQNGHQSDWCFLHFDSFIWIITYEWEMIILDNIFRKKFFIRSVGRWKNERIRILCLTFDIVFSNYWRNIEVIIFEKFFKTYQSVSMWKTSRMKFVCMWFWFVFLNFSIETRNCDLKKIYKTCQSVQMVKLHQCDLRSYVSDVISYIIRYEDEVIILRKFSKWNFFIGSVQNWKC